MEHFSGHSKHYSLIPEFAEPSPLTVTPTDKRIGQIYLGINFRCFSISYVHSKMTAERISHNRPAGSSTASLAGTGTKM